MKTFREGQFKKLGLPTQFAQDNHSRSVKDLYREAVGVVASAEKRWQVWAHRIDSPASHYEGSSLIYD